MKLTHLLPLTIFLGLLTICYGYTIKQIIRQNDNLQELSKLMTGTNIMKQFNVNGKKKYYFFAPVNQAFNEISKEFRSKLYSTNDKMKFKNIVLQFHAYLNMDSASVPNLKDGTFIDVIGRGRVSVRVIDQITYINGARIIGAALTATNGYVFLVSDFLCRDPDLTTFSGNAFEYLESNANAVDDQFKTSKFLEMMNIYTDHQVNQDMTATDYSKLDGITAFIPSNAALASINPLHLNQLMNNRAALKQVIEGHFITTSAYHEKILMSGNSSRDIPAMYGNIHAKHFRDNIYVSNECAQGKITRGNITTQNGVVHIIDSLLAFVFDGAYTRLQMGGNKYHWFFEYLRSSSDLVKMLKLASGESNIPDSRAFTLFVPVNVHEIDYQQDNRQSEKIVQMHILRGRLPLSNIEHGMVMKTLDPDHDATFFVQGTDVFIEVNYIRGKLLSANQCLKNGILHEIDTILGVPGQTIGSQIQSNLQKEFKLTQVYRSLLETGLWARVIEESRDFTLFAAVDDAFTIVRQTNLGRKLLMADYDGVLKRVMKRHMITGSVFLEKNMNKKYTTLFGDVVNIAYKDGDYFMTYGTVRARVLRSNMRMKNGALHYIDRLLFSVDPTSSEWTSAAPSFHTTSTLTAVLVLFSTVSSLLGHLLFTH